VEAPPLDVKEIQNMPLGVAGFWFRAMLNHANVARLIQEKDRPILMHLIDIQCNLHAQGYGYELVFVFEKNDYFTNTELKKSFTMSKQNVIEKCEGTDINWKDGRDVTKKKIKKKSKSKKAPTKTVTKTVEQESFFNFFKTLAMPTVEQITGEGKGEKTHDDQDEEEKDMGEKMDIDYDMGNEFKDQLIPLALEYYMEVIQDDAEDDEDGSCESGDDHHHHHGGKGKGKGDSEDDEEDEGKAAKKGGNKGAKGKGKGPAGKG
jgi:nucleosome assembly protein 1-like 1